MNIYREVRKKMSSDLGYDFHSDTWTDEMIELFNETVDTTKIVVEKLNIDSVDSRRELLIATLHGWKDYNDQGISIEDYVDEIESNL